MKKRTKVEKTDIQVTQDTINLSLDIKLPKILHTGFKLREIDDYNFDENSLWLFLSLEPKENNK